MGPHHRHPVIPWPDWIIPTSRRDNKSKDKVTMHTRARRTGVGRPMIKLAVLGFCGVIVAASSAGAETLREAVALAYTNNPDLRAARANLRVVDEGVPQAKANWRPVVSASLALGATYVDSVSSGTSSSGSSIPRSASVTITQPVYRAAGPPPPSGAQKVTSRRKEPGCSRWSRT